MKKIQFQECVVQTDSGKEALFLQPHFSISTEASAVEILDTINALDKEAYDDGDEEPENQDGETSEG